MAAVVDLGLGILKATALRAKKARVQAGIEDTLIHNKWRGFGVAQRYPCRFGRAGPDSATALKGKSSNV